VVGSFDAAIDAFRNIGANRWSDIAARARRIVFPDGVPHERTLRQLRIGELSPDDQRALDELTSEFFEDYENVFPLVERFARAHAFAFAAIPVTDGELPDALRLRTVDVGRVRGWRHTELAAVLREARAHGLACIDLSFHIVLPDSHDSICPRPEVPRYRSPGEEWFAYADRCARACEEKRLRTLAILDTGVVPGLGATMHARMAEGVKPADHLCVTADFIRENSP
jgi:hypothetical protein